jgi:hypothetical protein
MSARGVDFLKDWIGDYVPAQPRRKKAKKLGEQLRIDAAAAGLTLDELEIDKSSVEQYIFETMLYLKDQELRAIETARTQSSVPATRQASRAGCLVGRNSTIDWALMGIIFK